MLFLRTFGGLSLTGSENGVEAGVNGTRLSLLAFLAANPDGVRRDRIFLVFWGDSDQDRARNALKQAVFALRRFSGFPNIIIGVDELRINQEIVRADVVEFRTALRSGDLEKAVALYQGPFLDGVYVRAGAEFDQWRETEQKKLINEYQSALKQLAQRAHSKSDHESAIGYWKRLVESAPLDSRAVLGLIEALNKGGDRAEALSVARNHEDLVRRELDIAPDKKITDAVFAMRASRTERSHDVPGRSSSDERTLADGTTVAPTVHDDTKGQIPATERRSLWRKGAVAAIALVGGVAAIAVLTRVILNRNDSAPPRTMVIAFDNNTGDPSLNSLGSLVADWTATEIGASGITPVSPTMRTLSTGPRSTARASSADLAMKAVTSDGYAYAVGGAIYKSNDSIIVSPVVVSSRSKAMLASIRPVRVAPGQLERAADDVAQMVTGALAVAMNEHVSVLRTAAERAPRYDAYVQYLEGLELFHDDQRNAAYQAFARARDADSTFLLPIIWQAFAVPTRRPLRDSLTRVLESYGERLSPLEHYAAGYLRADLDDDQQAALQNALRAAALAPGSNWSYNAATKLALFNKPREALELVSKVDPHTWVGNWPAFWRFYIATAHGAGDDALAYKLIDKAQNFGVSPLVLLRFHMMLEAAGGNEAGVTEDYKQYTAITSARDSLMLFFAIGVNEAAFHGHPGLRRKLGDSLISVVTVPGDTSADRLALLADAYVTAGRNNEAWPLAIRYRPRATDSAWTFGLLGLIAARTNRRVEALAYADSLAALKSGDKGYVTWNRARIYAALHDDQRALRLIRQTYAERKQIMWQHGSDFEELKGNKEFEALRDPDGAAKRSISLVAAADSGR